MIGIYKIENKVNGKVYIGKSIDLGRRWQEHIDDLEKGAHHSYKLQNAYCVHGITKFTFEIVKICTLEELDTEEARFSDKYDSIKNGYNVQGFGDGCDSCIYEEIVATQGKIVCDLLSEKNRNILSNKLNILTDTSKKLNSIYLRDENSLSIAWFNKSKNNVELVQKSLYTYFQNNIKYKAKNNNATWTTHKEFENQIAGKGNTKARTSMYGVSEVKNKYLAFMANVYINDFKIRKYKIDKKEYMDIIPLLILVRWIVNNMDINEDSVTLYIPSERMRNLLINWLKGGDK